MLSETFKRETEERIAQFEAKIKAKKFAPYDATLKVLRFLLENHYLPLICNNCGEPFFCSGFCLVQGTKIVDGNPDAGCICASCDRASPEWQLRCNKKKNNLFYVFSFFAEQRRLRRKRFVKQRFRRET